MLLQEENIVDVLSEYTISYENPFYALTEWDSSLDCR